MTDEILAFDQWVEEMGWAAKWESEGEARGRAEGRAEGEALGEKTGWQKALELLKRGYTVEELERMSPPAPGNNEK